MAAARISSSGTFTTSFSTWSVCCPMIGAAVNCPGVAENFVAWLDRIKASPRTSIRIVHERYRKFFTGNAELVGP